MTNEAAICTKAVTRLLDSMDRDAARDVADAAEVKSESTSFQCCFELMLGASNAHAGPTTASEADG
jgi:hypothetical protein